MNEGDYVTRKSYGGDVLFRIERIDGNQAYLRGVEFRLLADAPLDDLAKVENPFNAAQEQETRTKYRQAIDRLRNFRDAMLEKTFREWTSHLVSTSHSQVTKPSMNDYFEMPGKVLHLDGDPSYLRKSIELYRELRVPVEGYHVEEARMAEVLHRLLPQAKPNILVITGHDGMYKKREDNQFHTLKNYKNSLHFAEAVQTARQYERGLDSLIIIAGACQSHFEALLQAGANFASSPARILIHAMDPVQIASKIAYTSLKDTVSMHDVAEHTMTGMRGIGGVETRGCFRIGLPNIYKK